MKNLIIFGLLWFLASGTAFAQLPRVDSIEPTQGTISGGIVVTIRGVNFTGATVKLNNTVIIPLVQTDAEIQFETPPHDNGIALITISNAAGKGFAEFLYVAPTLAEIAPGHITTIAGVGQFDGDGRPATEARVGADNIALDSKGNLYIVDANQAKIRRVRPDGIIETFAGTGVPGSSGDGGPAIEATFQFPRGIAIDSADNVYVADPDGHHVRRVDANTGIITTIAGTGVVGFSGDGGPAVQAQFNFPGKVAVDNDGNVFVLDVNNVRIRRISHDGIITTIAGTGVAGFSGDGGPAIEAQFDIGQQDGGGLAVDGDGNVYLGDTKNGRVRKIDRVTGIIDSIAFAPQAREISVGPEGNIWFAVNGAGPLFEGGSEELRERIIQVTPSGSIIATFGLKFGFSQDGTVAQDAPFGFIEAVQLDQSGNILFTELESFRVRRINFTTGLLETAAGMGPAIINETGPAIAAVLNPLFNDLLFLPSGELLVADDLNGRVRMIDIDGNISTVGGNGFFGFGSFSPLLGEEGPALETTLVVSGLDMESNGDILMAISDTAVVRLDEAGIVRKVAGGTEHGFSGDGGPATEALFSGVGDVITDQAGNILLADSLNNRIRRIDSQTGTITTIAGSGPSSPLDGFGLGSLCGDGGLATDACLNTPLSMAVDNDGNLFIADSFNFRIRKVDSTGTINTFVDLGTLMGKLVFDRMGNLYTYAGDSIVRISPDASVSRIAGGNGFGFSGDGGSALEAQINPATLNTGIEIDREGNLFFVDQRNRRIRAVKFGAFMAPAAGDGFLINTAISDAWFFPPTSGQGFFIIVWEDRKEIFLSWFTYDTQRPPEDVTAILGEPGHRWVTAQGPYEGDTALLDIVLSSGMVFDSTVPAVDTVVLEGATIKIVWIGCDEGLVEYDIPSLGLSGDIPIQRIVLDNVAACEAAQLQ